MDDGDVARAVRDVGQQRLGLLHREFSLRETPIVTFGPGHALGPTSCLPLSQVIAVGRWLCRTPPWPPSTVEQISIYSVHAKPPKWDPRPFISIAVQGALLWLSMPSSVQITVTMPWWIRDPRSTSAFSPSSSPSPPLPPGNG